MVWCARLQLECSFFGTVLVRYVTDNGRLRLMGRNAYYLDSSSGAISSPPRARLGELWGSWWNTTLKKRVDHGNGAKKRGECLSDSKASVSTDGIKSKRPPQASHEQCKWTERFAMFIFQLPKIFLSLPEIAKRRCWSWKINTLRVSLLQSPKMVVP